MVTSCYLACPACEDEIVVSGVVLGGGTYTLGDHGPPGCVFIDPVVVEDIAPTRCPHCLADIASAAAEALEYRAEADARD
jgi:hypothetical protein